MSSTNVLSDRISTGDQELEKEIDDFVKRNTLCSNAIGIVIGLVCSLVTTEFIIGLSVAFIEIIRNQNMLSNKSNTERLALYSGAQISEKLSVMFTSLETMTEVVIKSNYTIVDWEFRDMVKRIRKSHPLLNNIEYGIGPNLTISFIDPMPSDVFGLQMYKYNANHAQQINKAIQDGIITMYGPFSLVQGGVGLVAQHPIYLPGNIKSIQGIYGISAELLILNDLLKDLNIYSSLQDYYYDFYVYSSNYIFARKINDDAVLENTIGMNVMRIPNSISVDLNIVGERWRMDIVPKIGWYHDEYIWLETIIIILLIIIGIIVTVVVFRQLSVGIFKRKDSEFIRDKLEIHVRERTKDVLQTNMLLMEQVDKMSNKHDELNEFANSWGLSMISCELGEQLTHNVISINNHFAKLTSYTEVELIGTNINLLFMNMEDLLLMYRKLGTCQSLVRKLIIKTKSGQHMKTTSSIKFKLDEASNCIQCVIIVKHGGHYDDVLSSTTGSSIDRSNTKNVDNDPAFQIYAQGNAYVTNIINLSYKASELRSCFNPSEIIIMCCSIHETYCCSDATIPEELSKHCDIISNMINNLDYRQTMFDQLLEYYHCTESYRKAVNDYLQNHAK